ncbi:RagB/SusD family nutrient uptake outer membrane protein [Mucilaginibacter celer]|uniref:RagB/SusD family nutrient uptake outer membrane protein n=1 Tax=Mucilaginibacter celer TaxID=2305508 RepID=A0A494VVX1_9SPHI|nr:RagB/SusD family nutrient uptake outer membrane protein [Mucilaginibacter celer]AYL97630.1 RagB/SusD family nutrient uptake outer membrane protein [Mucilaginibacter celer]
MKRKYILILFAFVIAVSPSCKKFVIQEPQTALTEEQVFSKLDNIEPLVLGLYTSWRNVKKDRGGFMFTLGSDEAQQGAYQVKTDDRQAGLDRYNGFLAPSNTALAEQWNNRWPVISAAAKAVYALGLNKEEGTRKNLLLGESSFIRAALTFEISQYWGEIPIIDQAKFQEYGTKRQPLPLVYQFIINDLETAVKYLPETQTDKRRATKGAALALLGKVYLYAPAAANVRDFAKAKSYFEQVVNSGKYALVANYADLWDPNHANSTESIYEFQFNNVYPDNNQCQWQMGSRSLADIDQYCYFGGYDLMVPTQYCYSDVSAGGLWEDGDVRKGESIRYDFKYKGKTPVLNPTFGGDELDPHVKKYEDIRTDGTLSFWLSGKDIFFLRYADILLCYAETLNETGATSQAVDIVNNQIRKRAWGGTLPVDKRWNNGMGADEFRTKMLDERMRELCFEGWRRMDLIRSGKLVDLVKARNKWTKQSGTIQQYHNRYPIPLQEIKQNDDIGPEDQNPGYTNN